MPRDLLSGYTDKIVFAYELYGHWAPYISIWGT